MASTEQFVTAFTERVEQPRTLIEGAYRQLRNDIIEGRLAPGEKLRVEHLKERYGVGGSTLREALSLLLSDALVIAEGQRGFRVAGISLKDFADITRVRILIETEAIKQSISKGTDEWEAGLVASFHRLTKAERRFSPRPKGLVAEWEDCNRTFHEALIGACDSHWLRYMLGLVYRQSERYRHIAITHQAVKRDVHAEHTAIFEAAMARDIKRAKLQVEKHIQLTFESVRRIPAGLISNINPLKSVR